MKIFKKTEKKYCQVPTQSGKVPEVNYELDQHPREKSFMKKALLTLAITALAASAQAQNFNNPPYVDGALVGQDSWTQIGTVATNPIQVTNTATNGVAVIQTLGGQDAFRTFAGGPVTPANSTSIQLNADITLSAAQATGEYFLALTDGGSSNFNDRVFAKAGTTAGTFQLGLSTGSGGTIVYGADLTIGTTYNIGALYNFVAGATNDTAQLFVNSVAYVAGLTTGTDASSLTSILIRQGSNGQGAAGSIDNLSVTVAPIPEPATWMLMGLGLLIGAQRLRRKA
jgi:hypothetical protein